ncbi:MAG: mannitol dehydrogenase family protein [Treponema sp.]|jgi:fructuronate reductase|nr:mannitol dehydrogenase family protein [Treponema sp.]
MKLNNKALKDKSFWETAGIALPSYDREAMIASTKEAPKWVHFGAGNIFRAFPATLCQSLLEQGLENTGVVVVEGYDGEIIDRCFTAFDNLSILVTLKACGNTEKQVVSSVALAFKMEELGDLREIFASPSLQMASFTVTEKGYSLGAGGALFPDIAEDIKTGPASPKSFLGRVAALCHERFVRGRLPLAMVSMDNCSHNGDVLFTAIETIAKGWTGNGAAQSGFLDYVRDKNKLSFPWTMIDKITPRPDDSVRDMLISCGLEDMHGFVTRKNTFAAPFVNAEETQYLVVEDVFPNSRPPLEKAGVIFTDRETVDKVERMKVCACLNPLHTSLAVFGCLLGYTRISEEMKDPDLVKLIEGIGRRESLPVTTNPLIIKPEDFLDQVIRVRLPNPFIPDTPQRIATDSSLKIPIRFGETIKAWKSAGKDCVHLEFIPLVLAGWLRYFLSVDDQGRHFEVSPDPNYESIASRLSGATAGQPKALHTRLEPILSNPEFFGVNLYEARLGEKVEELFSRMLAGPGAVRKTLCEVCSCI